MTTWSQIATTRILVDLPTLTWDGFTSRTETDGWGTSQNGEAWTTLGGSAPDYAVASGAGLITLTDAGSSRNLIAGPTAAAMGATVKVTVPALATDDAFYAAVLVRAASDLDDAYIGYAVFGTAGTVDVSVERKLDGSFSTIGGASDVDTYAAGDTIGVRLEAEGTTVRARVWNLSGDEPDDWQVEVEDANIAEGVAGVRAERGGSNTNTDLVLSFDDYLSYTLNERMVDIAPYALTVGNLGQSIESSSGRQTELEQMEPSRFSMRLNNFDGRFTPGNPNGAYYPYWRQGRHVRWTETIEWQTFTLFDGYLEIPEVQLTFEAAEDSTITDRTVTVAAVDELTRLGRTRPFASTLAAHILGSVRNNALKHFWTLGSPRGNAYDNLVDTSAPVFVQNHYPETATGRTIVDSSTPVPPGDDLPSTLSIEEADGNAYVSLFTNSVASLPDGHALTIVGWCAPADPSPSTATSTILRAYLTESGPSDIGLISIGPASGIWGADVTGGAISASVPLEFTYGNDAPVCFGLRYTTTDEFEFWFNDEDFSGSISGSAPTTTTLTQLDLAEDFFGRLSYVQVYVGPAEDFTFDDYREQYQVGLYGLERQRTGERIQTIAAYAGVPESALDGVDDGTSVMQRADLAGLTAAQAIQQAADTERGRLFTSADQLVFHDRHEIYDG